MSVIGRSTQKILEKLVDYLLPIKRATNMLILNFLEFRT